MSPTRRVAIVRALAVASVESLGKAAELHGKKNDVAGLEQAKKAERGFAMSATKLRALLGSAVVALTVAAGGGARAAYVEAWDFSVPGNNFTNGNWDFGAIFTVNEPRLAVAVGYYYSQTTTTPDPTALYQCGNIACTAAGPLLGTSDVSVADPIIPAVTGHFRWDFFSTGVWLLPGFGYEVAGGSEGNLYTWNDPGFYTTVNYVPFTDVWQLGAGDAFLPAGTGCCDVSDGYWGPNVLFAGVPEPSTWAMMLAGFAGLSLAGYRRNARRDHLAVA